MSCRICAIEAEVHEICGTKGEPTLCRKHERECVAIARRLVTCADNGYDTAELHGIVEDARKVVR